MPRSRKPANPFHYLNSSPETIRLVVMMYMRFPLSLRNVEAWFAILDPQLGRHDYAVGDGFTIADAALFYVEHWAQPQGSRCRSTSPPIALECWRSLRCTRSGSSGARTEHDRTTLPIGTGPIDPKYAPKST